MTSSIYINLLEDIGTISRSLQAEEIHQFVVQAADAMQLAWPPAPESFQELPRPMQSRVDEGWFQRPEQKQGKKKGMVEDPSVVWVED